MKPSDGSWLLRAPVWREAAARLLRTGGERPGPLVPAPGKPTHGSETKEDVSARAGTEKSQPLEEHFTVGVKSLIFYNLLWERNKSPLKSKSSCRSTVE